MISLAVTNSLRNGANSYGPTWAVSIGTVPRFPLVMTVDPAVVEYVLKSNFENFIKGPRFHDILEPLLGEGIFNTDGHQWKWQRKVSSHIFTGKNFREVVETIIHEDINKLVDVLSSAADDGREFDLHLFLHAFTMDTFGKVGFGIDLRTLDNPTTPPAFTKSFDLILTILNYRFTNSFYNLSEHLDGNRRLLNENLKVVNDFVYGRIKEKKAQLAASNDGAKHKDLLDLYINYNPDMTDKELKDMVLNMLIGVAILPLKHFHGASMLFKIAQTLPRRSGMS
ncbi:cytochrome P450 [Chytridium lagenaria]|nr:cytochrome P450 [Chytridium lagenaria]